MKQFFYNRALRAGLTGVMVFLLLQCGLAARQGQLGIVDPVFEFKFRQMTKLPGFDGRSETPTILFLGSSRTMCGLDAEHFSEKATAYNFGIPAAGPVFCHLYLRRILERGVRPSCVVLEILPPFLAGQHPESPESPWLHHFRLYSEDYPRLAEFGIVLERPDFREEWLASWQNQRTGILLRLAPSWKTAHDPLDASQDSDSRGWVQWAKSSVTPDEYQRGVSYTRSQYDKALTNFVIGGSAIPALNESAALCRNAGIPLVLLRMPEADEFRSWYSDQNWQSIEAFVSRFADQHGLIEIDASEWMAKSFFADGHHLMPEGAREFTRKLRKSWERQFPPGVPNP